MDDQTREALERIVRTGKSEAMNVTFDGKGGFEVRPTDADLSGDENRRSSTLKRVAARLNEGR